MKWPGVPAEKPRRRRREPRAGHTRGLRPSRIAVSGSEPPSPEPIAWTGFVHWVPG